MYSIVEECYILYSVQRKSKLKEKTKEEKQKEKQESKKQIQMEK